MTYSSPAFISVATTILVTPAQAQNRFYTGAGLGGFAVSADDKDGRSVWATLIGGAAIARHLDVEIEFARPADDFTRSYTGPSGSFAPPGASQLERDRLAVVTRFDKSRDVTASCSAVIIIQPELGKRVTPGLIVGVTNHRVHDRTNYTPVSIPDGVDPHHPAVIARSEETTRNIGGPTVGAQVAIALTPHVSLVPDLRFDYGSIGDEINNVLRTSVRIQWRF